MTKKPKIIAIVGSTATGKSDLAVVLAKKYFGEIISADSRQVYRGLNIGAGKITTSEMRGVPHHLLDVADPKRMYSVAKFQRDGKKVIVDILRQGKVPIVVGGSGFYLDALLTNMSLPKVKADMKLRMQLEKFSKQELYQQLLTLDPRRAEEIDKDNPARLIRAVEIATLQGPVAPISRTSPYDVCWIGLKTDNELLKERIAKRLTKRMRLGMLAEFKSLHERGLSYSRMEELGLEYRYGARLLQKLITREEFESALTREIFRYAKRQMTWFKKNKEVHWLDIKDKNLALELVAKELYLR